MEKREKEGKGKIRRISTAGTTIENGKIVELVKRDDGSTRLALWNGVKCTIEERVAISATEELVPYSTANNLIAHGVVLLPSEPLEYGSEEELVAEIRAYIRKYVDVSERFEQIAAYYVLLTWVYDRFNELPYLRLRGDYGTGKTRFLLTVGSLCYRPTFASGASTVAPIFYSMNTFRGTLIIDEGDFRASDAKADIVKILNNGNVRGLRVLRMQVSPQGEYSPRAFDVYGPKIVATRGFYDDRALESRFITEEMTGKRIREDIPINLGNDYENEALHLRNKLLLYRFKNWARVRSRGEVLSSDIEPRLRQIFGPLLSIVDDEALRTELEDLAREYHEELLADRGMDLEAQVLEVIRELFSAGTSSISIKEIAASLARRNETEIGRHITSRWAGTFIRKNLKLKTQKSHGIFVIPFTELPKIGALLERYGLDPLDITEDPADTTE